MSTPQIDILKSSDYAVRDTVGEIIDHNSVLTRATLMHVLARVEQITKGQRPMVGIVCRPEYASEVREMARDQRCSDSLFPTVGVYTDYEQDEPWLVFYDHGLLRDYLKRNEKQSEPA